MQKKDGSIIEILVTVRSLWINGQLNKLVVQNRDVGKFFAHAAPTASTSIEVNPPSQAAKSITPDSIKATFAALTAIIISMLGMAQDLLKPIRETLGLLRDSVNVSKASSDNKIMDSLPTEKIAALESALKRAALYSDFASVAAYSPSYTVSPYPYSFSFFLKASKQDIQNPDKSGATVEDPATAARTQSHVALSPHRFVNGAEYAYSVPLAINDGYGRKRLFFVQLELNDSTEAKADNLEKATVELARQVSHILESATDDQTKAPNP
ncbi:MAG: hypothetical protein U5M23_00335 [Marinagarivorans sp.]|nr:hypothetical protein [Marinagarivorans sp.]